MNKKAISPLIATVLLLAFAVSLGTMVVSYVIDATKSNPCENVVIALEGSTAACYNQDSVSFIVANKGDVTVTGLQARFIIPTKDPQNTPIANAIEPGSASKITMPYQTINPAGVTLFITPKILYKGEDKSCSVSELELKLQTCP